MRGPGHSGWDKAAKCCLGERPEDDDHSSRAAPSPPSGLGEGRRIYCFVAGATVITEAVSDPSGLVVPRTATRIPADRLVGESTVNR